MVVKVIYDQILIAFIIMQDEGSESPVKGDLPIACMGLVGSIKYSNVSFTFMFFVSLFYYSLYV